MPLKDKQQAPQDQSFIDHSAETGEFEWQQLLFLAAYNSKKAGIEPFALCDDDVLLYSALESFDKSELAVPLD